MPDTEGWQLRHATNLFSQSVKLRLLPDHEEAAIEKVYRFLGAATKSDLSEVRKCFEDSAFARRAVLDVMKFLPKQHESWTVNSQLVRVVHQLCWDAIMRSGSTICSLHVSQIDARINVA